MKLNQRVNYILLPVILGVFLVGGLFVFLGISSYAEKKWIEGLHQEMQFATNSFELERGTAHAALGELLNSAEFVAFVNSPDPAYRAFAFEGQLYRLINRAREHAPNLEQLQIIDPQGKTLVAVADGDPFTTPQLDLPVRRWLAENTGANTQRVERHQLLYSSLAGEHKLVLIQPFSASLLLDDSVKQDIPELYQAIMVSRLDNFAQLQSRLSRNFGESLQPQIDVRSDLSASLAQPAFTLKRLDNNDQLLTSQHPMFDLSVLLPNATVMKSLGSEILYILFSALGLTLFCFASLKWLIRQQVIRPINRLVEQVQASKSNDAVLLQPIDSNDEVAELNNAYLTILNDVRELAANDHLTGLPNRRSFQRLLIRQLKLTRLRNQKLALLYIDLDNFKRVNDNYGHATGDRLLVAFTNRLLEVVRPSANQGSIGGDTLARLAGDEFVLLLTQIDNEEAPRVVAERVLSLFDNGFEVDGISHNVQASIGIAVAPEDGVEAQTILRHADAAMYQAKDNGRNRFEFFNHQLSAQIDARQWIEHTLKQALEVNDFELVYMPIFESGTLDISGAEVLLRCPALSEQRIGPDQFIPVAESTGLIKQIDLWVIENALIELKRLRMNTGFSGKFAINISAIELHNEAFPDQVQQLIRRHQIDPAWIELELTETSLISSDANSVTIMQRLKALGVSLALDDFGTGYTAFNQLASFPVDCLKIDRSFVNEMNSEAAKKRPMVDIILALAKLYDLQVVAEGVETEEQLAYLRQSGCQQMQGYYLSKPLSREAWLALVTSREFAAQEQLELI